MNRVYNPTADRNVNLHPLFLDIHNLLPHTVPPILSVEITAHNDCYHLFSMWRNAFDELYSRIHHPSLQGIIGARLLVISRSYKNNAQNFNRMPGRVRHIRF